jgi:N-methylhydantoinase A
MTIASMHSSAREEIEVGLPPGAEVDWQLFVEMRYLGQGASVTVGFPYRALGSEFAHELVASFENKYSEIYGGVLPAGTPEAVTWRVVGATSQEVRRFVWPIKEQAGGAVAPKTYRAVFCPGENNTRETPVYARYSLPSGTRLAGPVILEESESTIVVATAASVEVLENLSILVTLEA